MRGLRSGQVVENPDEDLRPLGRGWAYGKRKPSAVRHVRGHTLPDATRVQEQIVSGWSALLIRESRLPVRARIQNFDPRTRL